MTENNEAKIPELLIDRVDLRALTVNTFGNAIDFLKEGVKGVSIGKHTELIIFTTFGTVRGSLLPSVDEGTEEIESNVFLHETIMSLRNQQLEEYSQNGVTRLVNDSGYIALKDVVITPFSNPDYTHTLSYFLLFPDQITGLTVGEKK